MTKKLMRVRASLSFEPCICSERLSISMLCDSHICGLFAAYAWQHCIHFYITFERKGGSL